MVAEKLRGIMVILHGLLMMCTFTVVYAWFAKETGMELKFAVPEILYPIVMVGVIGVSVVTALFHVVGGGIMGATAGGVLMGMKMGLFLGLAYAIGRLWLYAGASFAASCLFWPEYKWTIIGLGLLTVTCLAVQKVTLFVWTKVEGQ